MSTRNRRTSPAMVEASTMPVLVQLLAAAEALRSALVQLGGLEPPTSCSTDRRSNQLSYNCIVARGPKKGVCEWAGN